jgi:hypothetical protein
MGSYFNGRTHTDYIRHDNEKYIWPSEEGSNKGSTVAARRGVS